MSPGPTKSPDARIPEIVVPQRLAEYLDVMTRAVFQTGVRWKQIAERWEDYRAAFAGFDVVQVASFGESDVERILATDGVLRSLRKVKATIQNARTLLDLDRANGERGFETFLDSFVDYDSLASALQKRFAFMGPMNAWYFLFRVGRPVPRFEWWLKTIPGEHPRMREMVMLARSQGRSPER